MLLRKGHVASRDSEYWKRGMAKLTEKVRGGPDTDSVDMQCSRAVVGVAGSLLQ